MEMHSSAGKRMLPGLYHSLCSNRALADSRAIVHDVIGVQARDQMACML